MESGTIAGWNLGEGDSFGAGDIICSVETDKATVDFEAQDEGIVAKILVPPGGAEIQCGEPILVTVEDEAHVGAFADFVVDSSAPAPPSTPAAAPPAATPSTPTPTPAATPPTPPLVPTGERIVASPLAHKLAKELGHNIATIAGTGPGGRVIAADVREFVPMEATAAVTDQPAPAQAAMAAPATPIAGPGFMDYPLSESAKEVAARLSQSKRNVPHYYLTVDVSMDQLLKLRATLNQSLGDEQSLGVYELLLKAAGAAMKAVPSANASWMDSVVRVYDSVDINVVVGNGDALYTPVIRDVGRRGVKAISSDLSAAVDALDDDQTQTPLGQHFHSMGTFTVMNLGMYGIKSCAPIIREPQSCALALGTLENRIVPNTDPESEQIYKESVMMTATMSLDHRVVDGAVGAQWLASFKSHVENPTTLLL